MSMFSQILRKVNTKSLKKVAKVAIAAGTGGAGAGILAGASSFSGIGKLFSPGQKLNMPFKVKGPGGQLLPGFGGDTHRGRIQPGEMGACPPGYHLNKHPLSDGTPARSVCVRNRHTNYANGRAARRAGRRIKGTVKMLSKSFTLVHPKAPHGKFLPRGKK